MDIKVSQQHCPAAKETSTDIAVEAVLLELGGISSSKEEQTTASKAFSGEHVFALLPASKS